MLGLTRKTGRIWRRRTLGAFVRTSGGTVTIMMVVIFSMLLAFAGLIIDVGRIMNVHSEAGSYADRIALTAAAELDGENDALVRAVRAAVGDAGAGPIVGAGFRMSLSGDPSVGVQKLTFLSELGADPVDPLTPSPVAGDTVLCIWEAGGFDCSASGLTVAQASTQAVFVLVDSTVETENYIMFPIAAMIAPGMSTSASVAPQAIAGFTQEVCNFPPLMICNPDELQVSPFGGDYTPNPGQQILMKSKGPATAWVPGDFGFIQVPAGSGEPGCKNPPKNGSESSSASLLRCVLALAQPNTQCVSGHVVPRGGQAVSAHAGLNVRFDIWDAPLQNLKNNSAFEPSANVTKGKIHGTGNCTVNNLEDPPLSDPSVGLPRDSCFGTNNCGTTTDGTRRFGNGVTDVQLTAYWQANHGAPLPGGLTGGTRYDVYRYELDNSSVIDNSPNGEDGAPSCSTNPGIDNEIRDRRTLIMAVVNCLEHADKFSGQNPIPVIAFVQMFFTEPVGLDGASTDDLYAEVVGKILPGGDDGVLKEFPVLYR